MAERSWEKRVVAYLAAHGFYKNTKQYSARYVAYGQAQGDITYFLGPHGVVKLSRNRSISNAVFVTQFLKRDLLLWEQAHDQA